MTTVVDRVVRWNLDIDDSGQIYGDERERLRWYEGIVAAAQMQWLALPWAAAILVWWLGRPAVLPLSVMLVALLIPAIMCVAYVRRRQVDTALRAWTRKRVVLTVLSTVPLVGFILGAIYAYSRTHPSIWVHALGGAVLGLLVSGAATVGRRRRRTDESAVEEG
jgi:heme/copper-type cytochrome/quinol oxidase subunit 2